MIYVKEDIEEVVNAVDSGNMQLATQLMDNYKLPFNVLFSALDDRGIDLYNIAILADMKVSYLKYTD